MIYRGWCACRLGLFGFFSGGERGGVHHTLRFTVEIGAGQPEQTQTCFRPHVRCDAQLTQHEIVIVRRDRVGLAGHRLFGQRSEAAPSFGVKHENGSKLSSSGWAELAGGREPARIDEFVPHLVGADCWAGVALL